MVFYLIPFLNLRIQNRKRKTEIYLGIGVFEKRLNSQKGLHINQSFKIIVNDVY